MNATAMINIAKQELGMAEDDYRAMLTRVTGKASLKVMSDAQKIAVVDEMKRLGFKVRTKARPKAARADVRYAHVLWGLLYAKGEAKSKGRDGLNAFVRSRFSDAWGATPLDIDQMTNGRQIAAVIEALQAWCKRKGIPTEKPSA